MQASRVEQKELGNGVESYYTEWRVIKRSGEWKDWNELPGMLSLVPGTIQYNFMLIIIVSFREQNLRPKQGSSRFSKKVITIKHGYKKWRTHARVFS